MPCYCETCKQQQNKKQKGKYCKCTLLNIKLEQKIVESWLTKVCSAAWLAHVQRKDKRHHLQLIIDLQSTSNKSAKPHYAHHIVECVLDIWFLTRSSRISSEDTYRTSASCPSARLCSRRQCSAGSSCFTCSHTSNVQRPACTNNLLCIFHTVTPCTTAAAWPRRELFRGFTLLWWEICSKQNGFTQRDCGVCVSCIQKTTMDE